MRRAAQLFFLPCLLLFASMSIASTPPNPADYTIGIHVTSSQTQLPCFQVGCSSVLILSATIDGHKYLLQGNIRNDASRPIQLGTRKEDFNRNEGFLALGDYKAKLMPVDAKAPHVPYYVIQNYQILLSDGRLADFQVVGQTE